MMASDSRWRRRVGTAPAICIGTALLLVLLVGGWGAYRDLNALRHSVIQAEITRMRSHAERSVGRIEAQLLEEGFGPDLASASKSRWLREHWNRTIPTTPDCLYGAVVDRQGKVLSHSNPQFEGSPINLTEPDPDWAPFGPGITEASGEKLSGGIRAVDISVPINFQAQQLGKFHTGIDKKWLDEQVTKSRQHAVHGWIAVIGAILAVVLLSSVSLYRITRHTARLETALDVADARRVSEVSQLIVGMAHEVRNPLNAVRLNLYAAERVFRGDTQLDADEVDGMLSESVREIERVDELFKQLLGYARVEPHQLENFNLSQEVQSALQFLRHSLDQAHVAANFSSPPEAIFVRMDRSQLRQILLNLVQNSCEAAGNGGRISLRILRTGDTAELSIFDTGPGVPAPLRDRIFDPFFTTKNTGTGMGLAVVRSLVEMAGGTIRCESDEQSGGCCFRLALPCATSLEVEAV